MPARQIHCRLCLALLCDKTDASDLWERKYVPQLSGVHRAPPLRELDSSCSIEPFAYVIECPDCNQRLRIQAKRVGRPFSCISCRQTAPTFEPQHAKLVAVYIQCGGCERELRISGRHLEKKFACSDCGMNNCIVLPGK